jgi:hypothetical protein
MPIPCKLRWADPGQTDDEAERVCYLEEPAPSDDPDVDMLVMPKPGHPEATVLSPGQALEIAWKARESRIRVRHGGGYIDTWACESPAVLYRHLRWWLGIHGEDRESDILPAALAGERLR